MKIIFFLNFIFLCANMEYYDIIKLYAKDDQVYLYCENNGPNNNSTEKLVGQTKASMFAMLESPTLLQKSMYDIAQAETLEQMNKVPFAFYFMKYSCENDVFNFIRLMKEHGIELHSQFILKYGEYKSSGFVPPEVVSILNAAQEGRNTVRMDAFHENIAKSLADVVYNAVHKIRSKTSGKQLLANQIVDASTDALWQVLQKNIFLFFLFEIVGLRMFSPDNEYNFVFFRLVNFYHILFAFVTCASLYGYISFQKREKKTPIKELMRATITDIKTGAPKLLQEVSLYSRKKLDASKETLSIQLSMYYMNYIVTSNFVVNFSRLLAFSPVLYVIWQNIEIINSTMNYTYLSLVSVSLCLIYFTAGVLR